MSLGAHVPSGGSRESWALRHEGGFWMSTDFTPPPLPVLDPTEMTVREGVLRG